MGQKREVIKAIKKNKIYKGLLKTVSDFFGISLVVYYDNLDYPNRSVFHPFW